jgi:hypothetical protein
MTRITGILREDQYTFILVSGLMLRRKSNVSGKSCRENRSTHFILGNLSENCVAYDLMWKNRDIQATYDNIIRHMRFECWIIKATDTDSEYVILIAFPR